MSTFEHPDFDGHERVLFARDPEAGLLAIIAIHSHALGPAAGGCRFWTYPDSGAALTDALRLSRGMSYKNALAGLDLGGGKAVIMRPDGAFDRERLFAAFGCAIDALGGAYLTAEDVGVSPSDMIAVKSCTPHVLGLPVEMGGSGDPSPFTARGVFLGIKACVLRRLDRSDLKGVRVAVQGVGHVGGHVARLLAEAGARLTITDIDSNLVDRVAAETDAVAVTPEAIYDVDADVFAPCALGGAINPHTVDRLNVTIVAGAANNQLSSPDMGAALLRRKILYAPDYVINAGGIINVAGEARHDYDLAWVEAKLEALGELVADVVDRAAEEKRPANLVADEMAREIIAEAKAG